MTEPLGTLAITLPAPHLTLSECLDLARKAEQEWGYNAIWLAETSGPDSFSLAAAISMVTKHVTIGSAIVPVFNRTPAVLAMSAATLGELSDGRFILGLGSSSHAIIAQWNGVSFEHPLDAVRDTVAICRQALGGNRTDYRGNVFSSKGLKLTANPSSPPPIYLAALREKMLNLAGEVSDGVIINLFPIDSLTKILDAFKKGAGNPRRDPERPVICRHQVGLTKDVGNARNMIRRSFAGYFATPVYNRFLEWCGYEDEMRKVKRGFEDRDREAVASALHDQFIDEVSILGDIETCQKKMSRFVEKGVTTTVLSPISSSREETLSCYEAFAPANQR